MTNRPLNEHELKALFDAQAKAGLEWGKHFERQDFTLAAREPNERGNHPIAGWIEFVTTGEHKGQWQAGVPKAHDPETDSDALHLGYFPTFLEARRAVELNVPAPELWI